MLVIVTLVAAVCLLFLVLEFLPNLLARTELSPKIGRKIITAVFGLIIVFIWITYFVVMS